MILLISIWFSLLNYYSSEFSGGDYSASISHDLWNELLKKNVTANGNVNYKGMMTDKHWLDEYLALLSRTPPDENWQRNDVMAYWINAYNAFTVKLILNHYPLKSINDINNGKPWDVAFIKIGDQTLTLNTIENDRLRKEFGDPRIHFAINCASLSCPVILNEAFIPAKLERQLSQAAESFINDTGKNKITRDKITISKIFEWYKQDFSKAGGVIAFLNQYSDIKINSSAAISFLDYDWSLNQ